MSLVEEDGSGKMGVEEESEEGRGSEEGGFCIRWRSVFIIYSLKKRSAENASSY